MLFDIEAFHTYPSFIDKGNFIYEHLREFIVECGYLQIAVGHICNPTVCQKMTATVEWQYLCAAHKKPQDCPAIDYMQHTNNVSAALLASLRHQPNRSKTLIQQSVVKNLSPGFRRLYRNLAHVYFHHPDSFFEFERTFRLSQRFTHFCQKYDLMLDTTLIIPKEVIFAHVERLNTQARTSNNNSSHNIIEEKSKPNKSNESSSPEINITNEATAAGTTSEMNPSVEQPFVQNNQTTVEVESPIIAEASIAIAHESQQRETMNNSPIDLEVGLRDELANVTIGREVTTTRESFVSPPPPPSPLGRPQSPDKSAGTSAVGMIDFAQNDEFEE